MKNFAASLKNLTICLALLIYLFPLIVKAERPDVQWMRGGHANSVRSMDYSPDGQLFASIGDSYGLVKIWRLSDGLMLRSLPLLSPGASFSEKVIFLPDSQTIAVFDNATSQIKIARISDGEILRTILVGGNVGATNLKALPDGTLFLATAGSGIRYYRLSDGVLLKTITGAYFLNSGGNPVGFGSITGKAFPLTNGSIAVSLLVGTNGTAYPAIINGNEINSNLGKLVGYHPSETFGMNGATNDGAFIISPNGGNNLSRIYRTSDLCPSPQAGCNGSTIPIAGSIPANGISEFSSDGQTFAVNNGAELRLFRTSNWSFIQSIQRFNIQPFVFSPNSQSIATGGSISSSVAVPLINFWNVADGNLQGTLNSHFKDVLTVSFSANGQTIASYSAGNSQASTTNEGTVRIWNSANGNLIREIRTGQDNNFGIGSQAKLLALSLDGQFVFNAAPNASIQVWRISDGSLVRTISTSCRGLTLSPDGQTLASINAGNGIELYRTSDGGFIRTISLPSVIINGQPKLLSGTRSLVFTPDGQSLIAGELLADTTTNPPSFKGYISFFRISDGGLIRTVETISSDVRAVAVSSDGQSVASAGHGRCNGCTSNPTTGLAELRRVSDGSLIRSFTEYEGRDYAVAFTPGGQQIATAGGEAAIRFWNVSDGTLARIYDQELPNNPTNSVNVGTLAFSPDGSQFAYGRQDSTLVMARNTSTPTARRSLFDFDGDGEADISVFRPSNGTWYVQQSTAGFTGSAFGLGTDKLVPADYDGDGKTDIAVYRGGTWYLQRSSLGFTGVAFGDSTDIPQPADYDGDGKADIAVFRPSNGVWYLLQSTAGFTGVQFGQAGDKPVAADYDGDGKTDVAVNRNGIWYIQRSTLGFTGIQFGDANDKLVQADYDGDGKADVAVFRPSNGVWYMQQSTAGFTGIAFGLGTDLPTPADYDGDGKTDVAVFRNGVWYLQRSQAGFTGVAFGASTDKPIPNAFVP